MTHADPWDRVERAAPGTLRASPSSSNAFVWYARDEHGCYHLLIQIDESEPVRELMTTKGLMARTTEFSPEGGPPALWIDVVCSDSANNEAFTRLGAEIVTSSQSVVGSERREAVMMILQRWRWFWSYPASSLSEAAALGLFGELWFLRHWIPSRSAVRWWRGPLGDRHDFVHPQVSVEIKTTSERSDSPPRHRITHIDQLGDPETGELLLFSLVAIPDQLATDSLSSLVEELDTIMRDTPEEHLWWDRLSSAGWRSAHADRHREPFRILSEALYVVDDAFPRILRRTFPHGEPPHGVDDISYSIDLSVVADTNRIATSPPAEALDPLAQHL